jgi:hypothetical protein
MLGVFRWRRKEGMNVRWFDVNVGDGKFLSVGSVVSYLTTTTDVQWW